MNREEVDAGDCPVLIVWYPQHYQLFMPAPGGTRNFCALPLAFGREVRRRRLTLGLTLEQLAERSSLTPNYIGTVEHGQRDPSLSTIIALARGLGVAPGELLGGIGEAGPLALEAARLIEAQPTEVQEAMLELLRSMSRRRRG